MATDSVDQVEVGPDTEAGLCAILMDRSPEPERSASNRAIRPAMAWAVCRSHALNPAVPHEVDAFIDRWRGVAVPPPHHADDCQLSGQPSLGRPGRVAGTRELLVADTRYLVPYRVRRDTIEILRVFHTSRRLPTRR